MRVSARARRQALLKADPERRPSATFCAVRGKSNYNQLQTAFRMWVGGNGVGRGSRKCLASGMQHAAWMGQAPPLSEPDRPSKLIVIANGRARKHNNTTPAAASAPAPAPVPATSPVPAAAPPALPAAIWPRVKLFPVAESNAICLPPLVFSQWADKATWPQRQTVEQGHKAHGRHNSKRLKSSAAMGRQSGGWPRQWGGPGRGRERDALPPNFGQVVKFVYA